MNICERCGSETGPGGHECIPPIGFDRHQATYPAAYPPTATSDSQGEWLDRFRTSEGDSDDDQEPTP